MFDLFKWNTRSFVLQAAPKAPLFRKTRRDVRLLQFFSKILVYKNCFSRKITQWTLPSRITVSDEDFKTVTAIWVYRSMFRYSLTVLPNKYSLKERRKKTFSELLQYCQFFSQIYHLKIHPNLNFPENCI